MPKPIAGRIFFFSSSLNNAHAQEEFICARSIKAECARAALHIAVLAETRSASAVNGATILTHSLFNAKFALKFYFLLIFERFCSRFNQNGKFFLLVVIYCLNI